MRQTQQEPPPAPFAFVALHAPPPRLWQTLLVQRQSARCVPFRRTSLLRTHVPSPHGLLAVALSPDPGRGTLPLTKQTTDPKTNEASCFSAATRTAHFVCSLLVLPLPVLC
jgi:hypothetical protein